MKHKISIVIPFYNEEENVEPLIDEIVAYMPKGVDYEIVGVEDGGTDKTYENLLVLQKKYEQLVVVRHLGNFGQSAGQLTGVRHAKNPWIITLDGDGQNMPQDLPLFLKELDALAPQHAEGLLINGNRRATRKDNALRKISTFFANGYRKALLGDKCPDSGCCYRLFDRDTFLKMPHFKNFHRFTVALFQREGAYVRFIPINHRVRERGVSKYGVLNRVFVGIIDTFAMMWLQRRPCSPKSELVQKAKKTARRTTKKS